MYNIKARERNDLFSLSHTHAHTLCGSTRVTHLITNVTVVLFEYNENIFFFCISKYFPVNFWCFLDLPFEKQKKKQYEKVNKSLCNIAILLTIWRERLKIEEKYEEK